MNRHLRITLTDGIEVRVALKDDDGNPHVAIQVTDGRENSASILLQAEQQYDPSRTWVPVLSVWHSDEGDDPDHEIKLWDEPSPDGYDLAKMIQHGETGDD
jgi:hypothetical protein